MNQLERGATRCINHYRMVYRSWCEANYKKRDGTYPKHPIHCWTEVDEFGKPYRECSGLGLSECIESYAEDGVSRTTGADIGLSIRLTDFFTLNVGRKDSRTVTFPAGTGFSARCRNAMVEAGNMCMSSHNECNEQAGGCG